MDGSLFNLFYEARITLLPKSNRGTIRKNLKEVRHQWSTPVIPATAEPEIGRIAVPASTDKKLPDPILMEKNWAW
jgi:hypothetical protein